jgi:hypothetical protein
MADQNQMIRLINPFEEYEKGRQRVLQEQQAAMVNQLYSQALDPRTGQIRYPEVYSGLARAGMGSAIPELQETEYKRRQEYAKTVGTESENFLKKIDMYKRTIPQTPGEAMNWVIRTYEDPDVGPIMSYFGSMEEAVNGVPRDPEGFAKWRRDSALFADKLMENEIRDLEGGYGSISKVTGEQVGPTVMKVPYDPELAAQRVRLAGAATPKPPVEETEYSKVVGKASGERDVASFDAANNAADAISRDYEVLNILDSGQPITGSAAELQLSVEKLKSAVSGRKNKAVEDTELLESLLGSDVFAQIQALGVGARGLDTPAEREFLRKVVAGTITLDAATLKRMAEIRIAVKERAIDRFNARVERGELDRYFERSGIPKRKIEKPKRPVVERGTAATGPANAPVRVNSKAEFDRLPSGSLFIDPQGNTRRKP